MRSENDSNFRSKTEAFLSFVLVFAFLLLVLFSLSEAALWLLDLFLTADH